MKTARFDLAPILEALRKRVPKSRAAEAEAFARSFYKRMSREEYIEHGADGWAALAAGILDFAATRKAKKANVRLFNATTKEHGWESPHTVLQILNDDMPFLVDSVTMALADMGINVHVMGHPVVPLTRDKAGKLAGVGEGTNESFIHIEIDRQPQEKMAKIEKRVREVLEDVRASVADWDAMRARMLAVAEELPSHNIPVSDAGRAERRNSCAGPPTTISPSWAIANTPSRSKGKEDMLVAHPDTGLGLLRGADAGKPRPLTFACGALHAAVGFGRCADPHQDQRARHGASPRLHGLHRRVVLRCEGQAGPRAALPRPVHLQRLQPPPVGHPAGARALRTRDARIGPAPGQPQRQGAAPHRRNAAARRVVPVLGVELFDTASGILGLQERVRSKLFLRRDRYGRFYSVLVYVPRDRHDTRMRRRIEAMLKRELDGEHVDTNVHIGESALGAVAPDRAPARRFDGAGR
jgi:glutamate dehydrogenase